MILPIIRKIFGSQNDRTLKSYSRIVKRINALEPECQKFTQAQMRQQTHDFRRRLENGDTLDSLLPEAFALVREASVRTLQLRHFDVQLMGGMVLHSGAIAEMRTGEGKTLVATLSAYLNALASPVHVVTVNDYLARRDAHWMGCIYNYLGLKIGVVQSYASDLGHRAYIYNTDIETDIVENCPYFSPCSRLDAYSADITYGTNNEFGFDYLRDNMVVHQQERVQCQRSFVIVDEVDAILIDEARTPLVISGTAEDNQEHYHTCNEIVVSLKDKHFLLDEKDRQVELTDEGIQRIETIFMERGVINDNSNLYMPENLMLMHYVGAALKAHHLFRSGVDYIVEQGKVVLIDEHTGRKMPGRNLADGLHQAIEAKEGLQVQQESQTLASITFQNYFRLYDKIAGMTGTAETEAVEFHEIYGLSVVIVPTNQPVNRQDLNDIIYLTEQQKYQAVIEYIKEIYATGAPILIGTISIESSEHLSTVLTKAKLKHNVLNAKLHEKEASIIADAGKLNSITIATNMAGRGTDIVLGGALPAGAAESQREKWKLEHEAVVNAQGLHIIGTERHESRRIDNQLRGRSARQGNPGVSRFFLSMEDSLMRLFASDKMRSMMQSFGLRDGQGIEHKLLTRSIEKAQRKVESRNFDIRKQLLEFDDVFNDQRNVIYHQRNEILDTPDVWQMLQDFIGYVTEDLINQYMNDKKFDKHWHLDQLQQSVTVDFALDIDIEKETKDKQGKDSYQMQQMIQEGIQNKLQLLHDSLKDAQLSDRFYRDIMLEVCDTLWKTHLTRMDQLRNGINLRAYANRNPMQEFKQDAYNMFEELIRSIQYDTIRCLTHVKPLTTSQLQELHVFKQERDRRFREKSLVRHNNLGIGEKKVPRNSPCPCGSEKKYKRCCGKV